MIAKRMRVMNEKSDREGRALLICGFALVCFAAGALFATNRGQITGVHAESTRVFELRVYHVVPGKLPELEARFRNTTSKVLAEHGIKVVGYWIPEGGDPSVWSNSFVFMVAHPSREAAKKNWDAVRADPRFQEVVQSEQANKLVERVDVTYMRPADFSDMR